MSLPMKNPLGLTSNVGPIPSVFFVFVDRANVLASHNVGRLGHLSSTTLSVVSADPQLREAYLKGELDYRPFIDGPIGLEENPQATGVLSAHSMSSVRGGKYPMELVGEGARIRHAPQAPSRLSGVFTFGDLEACDAASQAYGWDIGQVTTFELRAIPGTKVWRTNMEIVSVLNGLAEAGEVDTKTTRKL